MPTAPRTMTISEIIQHVLHKKRPNLIDGKPCTYLELWQAQGIPAENELQMLVALEKLYLAVKLGKRLFIKASDDDGCFYSEIFEREFEKAVQRPKRIRFGIIGPLLTTLVTFALSASLMVGLELGGGVGVWSGLTAAMPFLAALGTGAPALLAFAAILAAAALVVYAICGFAMQLKRFKREKGATRLAQTESISNESIVSSLQSCSQQLNARLCETDQDFSASEEDTPKPQEQPTLLSLFDRPTLRNIDSPVHPYMP